MTYGINIFFKAIIILIPLWSANAVVNIVAYFLKKCHHHDYPLDGGRLWSDRRRIFGPGKNIHGLPSSLLGGFLGGLLVHSTNGYLSGLAVFFGAIASGFFKRRLGLMRGEPLFIIDQSDYLFAAYILFFLSGQTMSALLFFIALCITIPVHLLTNLIAFHFKIRDTYW